MNLQSKPIANPVVVLREEFDEWAVLFNLDTAEAVGINPVGVSIWKLIDGQRSLEQMTAVIQEEYDEAPDGVAGEISTFVDDLAQRGFVGFEIENISQKHSA